MIITLSNIPTLNPDHYPTPTNADASTAANYAEAFEIIKDFNEAAAEIKAQAARIITSAEAYEKDFLKSKQDAATAKKVKESPRFSNLHRIDRQFIENQLSRTKQELFIYGILTGRKSGNTKIKNTRDFNTVKAGDVQSAYNLLEITHKSIKEAYQFITDLQHNTHRQRWGEKGSLLEIFGATTPPPARKTANALYEIFSLYPHRAEFSEAEAKQAEELQDFLSLLARFNSYQCQKQNVQQATK